MDLKHNPLPEFRPVEDLRRREAAVEIKALREGIAYHDQRYYADNDPEISDASYDKLFRRLQDLEAAFPDLRSSHSPTVRVGTEPVSGLERIDYRVPLLSLQAVIDGDEVDGFDRRVHEVTDAKRVTYALEPKFDGLSVEVIYRDGRLVSGSTRGNGEVGEEITHNLKTIGAVPLGLRKSQHAPSLLAVRGEVFMRTKGFHHLNKERLQRGKEPFANPRNAAAGLMRQLDPRKVAGKPLDIYFYEILDMEGEVPGTHRETLDKLQGWGLGVSPLTQFTTSLKRVREYHKKLSEQRDDLDYEIDGTVVKVDDHRLREELGVRARSPRWAIAWKFQPRREVTVLEDIVVHVGRTGVLTPVALLQPVDVGGVTVSRATLHNEDEVHRKDVRKGDRLRIARAGDVIPEVVERVKQPGHKRSKPFEIPSRCPVCGTKVVREGAYYRCPAELSCRAQLIGRIVHFASRNAMDIAHLSEKTAAHLVDTGLVKDLADLYKLSIKDLESIDGFAKKSATQLYHAIQAAKNPSLDRLIYALGIRHVGERTARVLAQRFEQFDKLAQTDFDSLVSVPEIGEHTARSVRDFFDQESNRDVLERMKNAGLRIKTYRSPRRKPLKDKVFVFTGRLQHFTRPEAKECVELLGGQASSSISGNTDYLVVGEGTGSKLNEAKRKGIKRIDEQEFEQMVSRQ